MPHSRSNQRLPRPSLLTKLALFVAIVVILTSTVANWLGYRYARKSLEDQIQETLRTVAYDRNQRLAAYVSQQEERVQLVASRTQLRLLLDHRLGGAESADFLANSTRILRDAIKGTSEFVDIWITDPDGRVVTATDPIYLGRDFSTDPDYQQGKLLPHLGMPHPRQDGYEAFLTAPATADHGRFLGVVMVRLNVKGLAGILSDRTGLGKSGEVLVATPVDGYWRYLLPPIEGPKTRLEDVPALQRAMEDQPGAGIGRHAGQSVLVAWQQVPYQPSDLAVWGMVVEIPESEAFEPIARMKMVQWLLEVGLVLLGTLAAFVLAKGFTKPISQLADTARRIAEGDRYARVAVRSLDELGQLGLAFNRMTDELVQAHDTLEARVEARTRELADANRDLEKARREAESANRAKSEFLANMSHEIRTPMNGVIGMAELLGGTELSREQQEYLGTVRSSADSLLRLLNDILDFSKIEAGKLELEKTPFGIRDCVEKTARTLALRASEKGLELACRIDPGVPHSVIGDHGRLRQIIVNLVGNAMKFTEQGEIVISVDQAQRGDDWTELHFSVRDTGIGIPEDKLSTIFQSFSQVDATTTRKYGGTGLGLTISAQLVELMQGKFWVESQLGKGTTFHFTARLGLSPEQQPQVPAAMSQLDGMRVLVVDDHPINRQIFQELLRSWKLQSTCMADGPSALRELRRATAGNEPYALVLLDCMMPAMDGFDFARHVVDDAQISRPHMIMISSASQAGESRRCAEVGIASYLTKPVVQSELLDTILQVMVSPEELETGNPPAESEETTLPLRVLLAEDGLVNQRVAVGLLSRLGHHVQIANNGREAVDLWQQHEFDVILMDLQMPEMDGAQATQMIRAQEQQSGRHIPIIAMTAAAMKGDRERCLACGMDDYLSKPIDVDLLEKTLGGLAASAKDLEPAIPQGARQNSRAHARLPPSADEGDQSLAQVPAIDFELARKRMCNCDDAALKELVEAMLDECPMRISELEQGLASQDLVVVRRAAHTLKGAASVFAASAVVELARRIETLATDEKLDAIREVLAPLKEETEQMMQALQQWLQAGNGE